ncbi:uncharacterized protein LOC135131087 [Zophobas morio]|uniref:uncharacterized protein LOC135131087 n=1 Tax=Zophobas morio TaxID=2755281 RepID=UPI0030832E43
MNFQHQKEMKDDPLKLVYVLGYKMFQNERVKLILKFLLCMISLILSVQTCFFVSSPDVLKLIKYGLSFCQMAYAAFVIFLHLYKNKWIDDIMNYFPLWDIDTAGDTITNKIKKESKFIKYYVISNTISCQFWVSLMMYSQLTNLPHRSDGRNPCYYMLSLIVYVINFAMLGHTYQFLYVTQQVKFQMYLFNKYVEEVCRMDEEETEEERLVDDQRYQEEVRLRLTLLVRRHCEFKRWRTMCLDVIRNFIIPFSVGAGVLLFMDLYSFLTSDQSSVMDLWCNALFTLQATSAFISTITAAETLQDESDNTFTTLMLTKWYNFNCENRKYFLIMLGNSLKPINLSFSAEIAIDYRLGMAIGKLVYSGVSVFF